MGIRVKTDMVSDPVHKGRMIQNKCYVTQIVPLTMEHSGVTGLAGQSTTALPFF